MEESYGLCSPSVMSLSTAPPSGCPHCIVSQNSILEYMASASVSAENGAQRLYAGQASPPLVSKGHCVHGADEMSL